MPVRGLLRGFASLAGAMFVTQAIGFIALAVASRKLGPSDLGAANFATNLAIYFAIPANFGLALLGIRDVAREPKHAREVVGQIMFLRLALGAIAFVVLLVLAPLIAADQRSEELLPLAALAIPLDGLGGEWALLGAERRGFVALARLAGQVVYAALLVTLIVPGLAGARQFVLFSVLAVVITSLATHVRVWQVIGRPRVRFRLTDLVHRARASVPLGIAVVMVQVSLTVGVVMLGYLDSAAAVGQFGVAQKLPLALYGVVQLWSSTLYPQAAKLMRDDRRALRGQVSLFTGLSLALGLPFAVGAVLLGPDLVPLLFGAKYGPAGEAFVLISLALALSLVTVNVGAVLAAGGMERRYASGRTMGAAVAVASNGLLIPLFGLDGAAAATIASEAAVLAFMLVVYRRAIGAVEVDLGRVVRSAAATTVMVAALLAVGDGTNPAIRVVIGLAVYLVGAAAFGVVDRAELHRLMTRGEPTSPA